MHVDEELHEILGAFVGPDLRDLVLFNADPSNLYRNHWLVRKSAAAALSQGFCKFSVGRGSKTKYHVSVARIGGPTWPAIIDKVPVLRADSCTTQPFTCVDSPDASALQFISQFAKPIRRSLVSREIAGKRSKSVSQLPPAELAVSVIMVIWLLVPASIRIRAYRGLIWLGGHMYGPCCSLKVQRLPLGMYVKVTSVDYHDSLANEYAAIQLTRWILTLSPPKSVASVGACIDTLSDDEEATLVCDLQKSLSELRAIPKMVAPEYAITNALSKACYDYRIIAGMNVSSDRGDFVGPFITEEEFNDTLRVGALPHVSHRSGHQIVFTHGDLNVRNILMRNGRLSGIVDWETSGWYPEYWDYTRLITSPSCTNGG